MKRALLLCLAIALPLAAQQRTDCDEYFPGSPTLVLCGADRQTARALHRRIQDAIALDGRPLVDALSAIACDVEREDDDIRRFVVDDAFSMRELAPDTVVDLLESGLELPVRFAVLTTSDHTLRLTARNVKRLESLVVDESRSFEVRVISLSVLERSGFGRALTERYAYRTNDPMQERAALFLVGSLSADALPAIAADEHHVLQPWALWTMAILGRLDSGEKACEIAHDAARSPWVHDYMVHAMMLLSERGDAISTQCLETTKSNRSWVVY